MKAFDFIGKNILLSTFQITTCSIFLYANQAFGQITADNTLPADTIITLNKNSYIITGGSKAGSNLFHSFSEFSIADNSKVLFRDLQDINLVIGRITGDSVSSIKGVISTEGSANLILLNPNGFIFGNNARLDVHGSFLASDASSILFEDGAIFSARGVDSSNPLLLLSKPIGLNLNSTSSGITINNFGHKVNTLGVSRKNNTSKGLGVNNNQTIGIVSEKILLDGGILNADSGNIILAGVKSGLVYFTEKDNSFTYFNFDNVLEFGDVFLKNKSLLDASGKNSGIIEITAKNLKLEDNSLLRVQHQTGQIADSINIRTSEKVLALTRSGLLVENIGAFKSGAISIDSKNILFTQGAAIRAITYSSGDSANINLSSENSLRISTRLNKADTVPILGFAGIRSVTVNTGNAGDISVSTQKLQIFDGALASRTEREGNFGITGNAGNINIHATEFIEVENIDPTLPSNISTFTRTMGNAGSIVLNTDRLTLRGGGQVIASTFAEGNAGIIDINASSIVEAFGRPIKFIPSSIQSSALANRNPTFNLPDVPTGNSGGVRLHTSVLNLATGGEVSVVHQGEGVAGNLNISADVISLDRRAFISSRSQSGKGGNILIKTQGLLQLRNQSTISARAGGTGEGGNIDITSPIILTFPQENSDIVANALLGVGGQINISTQGLLGFTIRDKLTPISDIFASSQFGLDGTINIQTPEIDTSSALRSLPETILDSSRSVVQSCSEQRLAPGTKQNEFVITGRGRLVPKSKQILTNIYTQSNWVELSNQNSDNMDPSSPYTQATTIEKPLLQIREANGWRTNSKGEVFLMSEKQTFPSYKAEFPNMTC